ncbi:MAG: hypothetical protein Q8R02_17010 [Hyphomonadaceae bacterium]|nr:hypothetical protein [Hyphomonadaceae bacterium]
MAEAVGTIRVDLFANTAEFGEGLNKGSGQLKRFAREAEKIARGFDKVGKELTRNLTLPLAAFGGFAIKAAADAQDLQGAFNISFGKAADSTTKWAEATGDAMGRSTQRIQETAIAFNEFFEDFAPNEQAAADLSKVFTVLTEDFAAFHNVSKDQAQEKLLSGLSGSAKALKKFGVDISDAAVKAKAYELGIAAANTELSEQQKVLARVSIVVAATAKEQGEVARSTGETAEETERAKEAFKELLVTVGNDLLPVFNSFLKVVTDVIKGFSGLDKNTRTVIEVVALIAAAAGPAALALAAVTRAAGFCATSLRVLTAASVSTSEGMKKLGLSAGGAAVGFLAFAPVADQVGKATANLLDNLFQLTPSLAKVSARAYEVRDALIAQGVGAREAENAVGLLVGSVRDDLSKVTVEAAKAFLTQADATDAVAESTEALAPNVDELIKSFGALTGPVKDNADQLQRIRDLVDPVSAGVREYTESMKLAKAAGSDLGQASTVFGLQLIESLGGVDKARVSMEKLPPVVQDLVRNFTEFNEFNTGMENMVKASEAQAEVIKKIEEESAANVKRINEGLANFAEDLTNRFDPAAVFTEQMAQIEAAFAHGKISADVYKQAKDAAFAETPEGEAQTKALQDRARLIYDIAGGLTDAATSGRDFGDQVKQLAVDFLKLNVIKPFFQNLLNGVMPGGGQGGGGGGFDFGAIAKTVGGFFGGARDGGGPVYPGMSYNIGSGVSEKFVPDQPGRIVRGPGDPASAGGVTVVQNFNGPDPGSFRRSSRQMARDARRQFAT